MKYSLRSLMTAVLVGSPLIAGAWLGYRWLYPPFISLPPALNYNAEERRELLRYLNERPCEDVLFDLGGTPSPMPISSAPAQNQPKD